MAKATHKGTCQWCGSVQKLPGGLLANHGYTVEHGWFNGVCGGSNHLPLQVSCDQIQKSIAWTKASQAKLREEIADIQSKPLDEGDESWMNVYRPELSSRTKGSVYLWTKGRFVSVTEYVHRFEANGKAHTTNPGKLSSKVREGKEAYIKHLNSIITKQQTYIERQQAVVDNWKPQPLLSI